MSCLRVNHDSKFKVKVLIILYLTGNFIAESAYFRSVQYDEVTPDKSNHLEK